MSVDRSISFYDRHAQMYPQDCRGIPLPHRIAPCPQTRPTTPTASSLETGTTISRSSEDQRSPPAWSSIHLSHAASDRKRLQPSLFTILTATRWSWAHGEKHRHRGFPAISIQHPPFQHLFWTLIIFWALPLFVCVGRAARYRREMVRIKGCGGKRGQETQSP